jgi:hydrogenase/urease accessory protein HupE
VSSETEVAMRRLSIFMYVVGVSLILTIPFAFDIWPAGFRWGHPHGHAPYERMIIAIYVSLGVCLILGARDPLKNAIIIDFTILSSVLHGAVMTYDAIAQEGELTHLIGDVPLLFLVAAIFAIWHPRRLVRRQARGAPAASTA